MQPPNDIIRCIGRSTVCALPFPSTIFFHRGTSHSFPHLQEKNCKDKVKIRNKPVNRMLNVQCCSAWPNPILPNPKMKMSPPGNWIAALYTNKKDNRKLAYINANAIWPMSYWFTSTQIARVNTASLAHRPRYGTFNYIYLFCHSANVLRAKHL